MNPSIKSRRKKIYAFVCVISVAVFILVAVIAYRGFSEVILNTQKDQLMNIVESVGNNIQVYLEDFEQMAEGLLLLDPYLEAEKDQDPEAMNRFLEDWINVRQGSVESVRLTFQDGTVNAKAGEDHVYTLYRVLGHDESFPMINIYRDEDKEFYFGIRVTSEANSTMTVYIPARKVFAKTCEYIKMGDNGYVMIKDSKGYILMHQVEAQIGINVLTDRMLQYPHFDFSELEVLIAHQLTGSTAVETYNSYWWADENPRKTKKVSAYMPLYLGNDFLVISAVIDYSEVAGTIQLAAIRVMGILFLLVVMITLLLYVLWRYMQLQEETAQENADLKQKNVDLEIRRQQEEAESHQQRLELIGTMTSGIAHEFNNLLTPIMGYSELILAELQEEDPIYEDVVEISESAKKAKEIIGQINRFSSMNAEKMMSRIHVSQAVSKALVLTEAAKFRNITMVQQLEAEKDVCLGNPIQIQQIVMNLCNNALQAMGKVKGVLTVITDVRIPAKETENWWTPELDPKQEYYVISVQDTGIGMDQNTIDQIFVPFFTTKRPGEGTGLGLAVVKRLVDAHQGFIDVSSVQGEGTCFRIWLPLLPEESEDSIDSYN